LGLARHQAVSPSLWAPRPAVSSSPVGLVGSAPATSGPMRRGTASAPRAGAAGDESCCCARVGLRHLTDLCGADLFQGAVSARLFGDGGLIHDVEPLLRSVVD